MPNYNLVSKTGYRSRSYEDLARPYIVATEEYNRQEEALNELVDKSNQFKYLSETLPEESKARQIYENYANDLNAQAVMLGQTGLNVESKGKLNNLRRRFSGEIGRLMKADEALAQEKKLRRDMSTKDTSMLYASDILGIDDFLDGNTPNLYGISGDALKKEAAQYAQSASAKVYSDPQVNNITKYYQEILQTQGYSPELMASFRDNLEAIPEFQNAVTDILKANGVEDNLTGINYEKARQQVINGIVEGAVYKESRNIHQNPGVLTAAQAVSDARQREGMSLNASLHGMVPDGKGGYRYDITKDPRQAGNLWMYDVDEATGQIKGYSKEYKDLLEKGYVGKGRSTTTQGGSGGGTGGRGTANPKLNLLEDISYHTDTEEYSKVDDTKAYGIKISTEQAMQEAPELVEEVGDNVKHYNFYKNDKTITRRRNNTSQEAPAQNGSTSYDYGRDIYNTSDMQL